MTEPIGIEQRRFAATINQAINFAKVADYPPQVQLLTDLVAEFAGAASARGYLAWFLLKLARNEEAIEQSCQAIRLAPGSETASLIHFHILWKSGQHIEALDEMRRFLTIRPSQEYTKIIKEWEPACTGPAT